MCMDIKYLAGFFDGEGSISIIFRQYKNGARGYQVLVQISNTNLSILEIFKEKFGGQIRPLKKMMSQYKQAWLWRIVSRQALSFLEQIIPYLIIKTNQAILAISFQKSLRPQGINTPIDAKELGLRNDAIIKMKLLNKGYYN